MKIISENMALIIEKDGRISKVNLKDHQIDLSGKTTGYLLDSENAVVSEMKQSGQTVSGVL